MRNDAGLEGLVDALVSEPSLKSCHPLPSVRGDLLAKLGRLEEARALRIGAPRPAPARAHALLRHRAIWRDDLLATELLARLNALVQESAESGGDAVTA
ncbi:MAG TPA: hypothetical protein VLB06_11415 [Sulfuricaulis sp.]|nr:hypothetical protein [Sulfuricaulis sp.]